MDSSFRVCVSLLGLKARSSIFISCVWVGVCLGLKRVLMGMVSYVIHVGIHRVFSLEFIEFFFVVVRLVTL